jgi:hypothetical protein
MPLCFAQPPLTTVQLLHTLADGSQHVDWMIAQDAAGDLPLTTFRSPRRMDDLHEQESVLVERLPDHRPHYLDYEGPISDGRGHVRQVARGEVRSCQPTAAEPEQWRLEVHWASSSGLAVAQQIDLISEDLLHWRVVCAGVLGRFASQ